MKIKVIFFIALVSLSILSCKKNSNESQFQGSNELKISFEKGLQTLSSSNPNYKIRLNFLLVKAENSDITFPVELIPIETPEGNKNVILLSSQQVIIPKGEKQNFIEFFITPEVKINPGANFTFMVKVGGTGGIPMTNNNEDLKITVRAAPLFEGLTEEQQDQLSKSKINLIPWIGEIDAEVNIEQPGGGYFSFTNPVNLKFNTTSIFTIAKNKNHPASLQITYNAFGLNDYFYDILRKNTIEVSCEDINNENCTGFNYELIEKAGWKRNDIESLNIKHPNLMLIPDSENAKEGRIIFTLINDKNETKIPYTFGFSVWKKSLKKQLQAIRMQRN